jgi:hypothetical protein
MRSSPPKRSPWGPACLGPACLGLLLLAGCAAQTPRPDESILSISPDFGQAVHQDIAAPIADPDARYTGTPAPGTDGSRVGLAQHRYAVDRVIPPATMETSTAVAGSTDNGGGGAGPAGPPAPQ